MVFENVRRQAVEWDTAAAARPHALTLHRAVRVDIVNSFKMLLRSSHGLDEELTTAVEATETLACHCARRRVSAFWALERMLLFDVYADNCDDDGQQALGIRLTEKN